MISLSLAFSFLSPSDVYLSPVSLSFLLLLIKGGGSLNLMLSTLPANDLEGVSPPTKKERKTERTKERKRGMNQVECQHTSVFV